MRFLGFEARWLRVLVDAFVGESISEAVSGPFLEWIATELTRRQRFQSASVADATGNPPPLWRRKLALVLETTGGGGTDDRRSAVSMLLLLLLLLRERTRYFFSCAMCCSSASVVK